MTFSKLTWHKRTHGHKFTGAEFRVLMSIFDHSSADGTNSHPGIKLMMAETGYGKAAVSTAVSALKSRGWIRETRKGSGVSGNASVFNLVPDAPQPPSSSPGGEQHTKSSSSSGVEQPSEVVRLERTSSSPAVNQVVRLEQSPSDPGLSDPGSDPDSSDQEEVRYPPNHLDDQDEIGRGSRSLADAGTDAPDVADGRGHRGPFPNEVASPAAAEEPAFRPASGPAIGEGLPTRWFDEDPFADRGERLDAREVRALFATAQQPSEWPPKRPSVTNRPRSFGERFEAANT